MDKEQAPVMNFYVPVLLCTLAHTSNGSVPFKQDETKYNKKQRVLLSLCVHDAVFAPYTRVVSLFLVGMFWFASERGQSGARILATDGGKGGKLRLE